MSFYTFQLFPHLLIFPFPVHPKTLAAVYVHQPDYNCTKVRAYEVGVDLGGSLFQAFFGISMPEKAFFLFVS